MSKNKILVVITGGTGDSLYSPEHEDTPHIVPLPRQLKDGTIVDPRLYPPEAVSPITQSDRIIKASAIPALFKKLGLGDKVEFLGIAMEDSKGVTPNHLNNSVAAIEDKVQREGYARVIFVHGTDTMAQNARYLENGLSNTGIDKTKVHVVFSGAMSPVAPQRLKAKPDGPVWREQSDLPRNLLMAYNDVIKGPPPSPKGHRVFMEMGEGQWDPFAIRKQVNTIQRDGIAIVTDSGFKQLLDAEGRLALNGATAEDMIAAFPEVARFVSFTKPGNLRSYMDQFMGYARAIGATSVGLKSPDSNDSFVLYQNHQSMERVLRIQPGSTPVLEDMQGKQTQNHGVFRNWDTKNSVLGRDIDVNSLAIDAAAAAKEGGVTQHPEGKGEEAVPKTKPPRPRGTHRPTPKLPPHR